MESLNNYLNLIYILLTPTFKRENIIDMKMKNLDTEITALTTEYNTVKTVITNSVKNSFTRYDA